MHKKIIFLVMLFFPWNLLFGKGDDSLKNLLSFHIGKRSVTSYDESNKTTGNFKDNFIVSSSLLLQKKVGHIGSFNVNAAMGLNCRLVQVGYKKATLFGKTDSDNFSSGTILLGFQSGLSIEKEIFAFKKHSFNLSLGVTGSGILFSNNNTSSGKVSSYYSPPIGDSLSVEFSNNRLFYINPYTQLTVKSSFSKRSLSYGFRFLSASNFNQLNANFSVFDTRLGGGYRFYKGSFLDKSNQLEIMIGLSF